MTTPHAPAARLVGYWKAALTDRYALPWHFEGVLEHEVRARLVAYLTAGVVVNASRGYSQCRYGCGNNGSFERTDGEWVWPDGLAHYVEIHAITQYGSTVEPVAIARCAAGAFSPAVQGRCASRNS